jgi:hypothetical protein
VNAGIKPQKEHYWEKEFIDRKYTVMIEGSWVGVAYFYDLFKY